MEGQTSTPRILLSTPLMFASNCFKLILGSSVRKKSIQTGLVPKVVLQRKGGGGGQCAYKSKYATQVYSIRNQESRMPSVSLSLSLSLSKKKKLENILPVRWKLIRWNLHHGHYISPLIIEHIFNAWRPAILCLYRDNVHSKNDFCSIVIVTCRTDVIYFWGRGRFFRQDRDTPPLRPL